MNIYRSLANLYTISLVFLFLLNYFSILTFEQSFLGLLTLIGILLYLPSTVGMSRWFSVGMLLVAAGILYYAETPIQEWTPLFLSNMPLIILILFVPILAIPLKIGQYNEEVAKVIASYREKPGILYAGITSTVFTIGSIINLGSLSIVHSVVDQNGFSKAFLGKAYVRGFTSVIIWSPFFASVFLILFTLDVSISHFLIYSLLLGLIQLLFANIWFNRIEKDKLSFSKQEAAPTLIDYRKLVELILIFILLMAIILISEGYVENNMSIFITLIVLLFSFFWSLTIRKTRSFMRAFFQYMNAIIPGRANEIVLFLAAGFFSGAFSKTSIGHYLQKLLQWIGSYSILLVILFILVLTVGLALVGIHQIVTITTLLASVTPVEVGISNLIFALTLTSSWSISTLLSPTTPVNVISSSLLHTKITNLIRWNLAFAGLMIIVYTLTIYIYHLIL